jgi:hypothetical protein
MIKYIEIPSNFKKDYVEIYINIEKEQLKNRLRQLNKVLSSDKEE